MKYGKEKQNLHRALISEIMVKNPNITIADIGLELVRMGFVLDKDYINRLQRKVDTEKGKRVMKGVERYLAMLEDEMNVKVKKYWEIIDNQNPFIRSSDRISAMRGLREERYAFLKALMDSGVLTRKLGEVDININHQVSPAIEAAIKCMELQFSAKMKPVIYEEAIIHEAKKDDDKHEQKSNNKPAITGDAILPERW